MSGTRGESNLMTEPDSVVDTADTIELCVISHGASIIGWSTQSGKVKLFSLKSNLVKVLGYHSDAKPTLLKFSPKDVLLLSSSPNGCVKV